MLCIVLSLSLVSAIAASAGSPFTPAAHILADRLTECSYAPNLGFFLGEQLWQSGATMETISNTLLSSPPPRLQAALQAVLAGSFSKTPVIVDNCLCVCATAPHTRLPVPGSPVPGSPAPPATSVIDSPSKFQGHLRLAVL